MRPGPHFRDMMKMKRRGSLSRAVATLTGSDPSNPLSANPAVETFLGRGFVAIFTLRVRIRASSPACCGHDVHQATSAPGSRSQKTHPIFGDPITCVPLVCSHTRCSARNRPWKCVHV